MKKIIAIYFILFCSINSFSQNIVFKSQTLKEYLVNLKVNDYPRESYFVDENRDGEIQVSEAQSIRKLPIVSINLETIEDIGNFINLEELYFRWVKGMPSIKIENLPKLKRLGFSNCPELSEISANDLESLTHLYTNDCRGIVTINYTNLPNLYYFSVERAAITSLDLSQLPGIRMLFLKGNKLSNLMLDSLSNLKNLDIRNNPFESLSFLTPEIVSKLSHLNVSGLGLISLDFIPQENNLIGLSCNNNNLTTMPVERLSRLKELNCSTNQIKSIDLTKMPNLKSLSCVYNKLENLDLSMVPNLEYLGVGSNSIEEIDLSVLTKLIYLDVSKTKIKELDLSNNSTMLNINASRNDFLEYVYLKNGSKEPDFLGFFSSVYNGFESCKMLKYICVDENEVDFVKEYFKNGIESERVHDNSVEINSYCTFSPGGKTYSLKGNLETNIENTGCSLTDYTIPSVKFEITNESGEKAVNTSDKNSYTFYLKEGKYIVKPILENPTYYKVIPNSFEVEFPTENLDTIYKDICLEPIDNIEDVEVKIFPTSIARPGFNSSYKIKYRNLGTLKASGTITLNYDDSLVDYVSSNISETNTESGKIKWKYNNLKPLQSGEINFEVKLNKPTDIPALDSGSILRYVTDITFDSENDKTKQNNSFTLEQEVVNSFDPNDKTCLNGQVLNIEDINKELLYLIRFENKGTANAINVVVSDVIDIEKFDLNSLIVIDSSHKLETKIKNNKVEFIFENINLSFNDSDNDGYIVFKIKPLSSLKIGDELRNKASIYFDFNKPIITNEFLTIIKEKNVINTDKENDIKIFPNPCNDVFFAESNLNIEKIIVHDLLGRFVKRLKRLNKNINLYDLKGIDKGLYLVNLYTDKGVIVKKIIKD